MFAGQHTFNFFFCINLKGDSEGPLSLPVSLRQVGGPRHTHQAQSLISSAGQGAAPAISQELQLSHIPACY